MSTIADIDFYIDKIYDLQTDRNKKFFVFNITLECNRNDVDNIQDSILRNINESSIIIFDIDTSNGIVAKCSYKFNCILTEKDFIDDYYIVIKLLHGNELITECILNLNRLINANKNKSDLYNCYNINGEQFCKMSVSTNIHVHNDKQFSKAQSKSLVSNLTTLKTPASKVLKSDTNHLEVDQNNPSNNNTPRQELKGIIKSNKSKNNDASKQLFPNSSPKGSDTATDSKEKNHRKRPSVSGFITLQDATSIGNERRIFFADGTKNDKDSHENLVVDSRRSSRNFDAETRKSTNVDSLSVQIDKSPHTLIGKGFISGDAKNNSATPTNRRLSTSGRILTISNPNTHIVSVLEPEKKRSSLSICSIM